jgi:hypothetical protein
MCTGLEIAAIASAVGSGVSSTVAAAKGGESPSGIQIPESRPPMDPSGFLNLLLQISKPQATPPFIPGSPTFPGAGRFPGRENFLGGGDESPMGGGLFRF